MMNAKCEMRNAEENAKPFDWEFRASEE